MKYLLLLILSIHSIYAQDLNPRTAVSTDQLGITLRGPSRQIVIANGRGSYFSTESAGENRSVRQGWIVDGRKIMDDYAIEYDNRPLNRSDVVRTYLYPFQFIREYKNGLREIVTLLDYINALTVEVDNAGNKSFRIRPYFKDIRDTSEMLCALRYGELIFGRTNHQLPTPGDTTPGWLGMMLAPATSFSFGFMESDSGSGGFSPAALSASLPSDQVAAIFIASDRSRKIFNLGATNIKTFLDSIYDRRVRIDEMFRRSYLRTDDSVSFRTIQWALNTLDQMMPKWGTPRLLDGFPGPGEMPAVSPLLALSGACIPAGFLARTRVILSSYAGVQDTNPLRSTYGRFPVSPAERPPAYDNAETAPEFCEAVCRYLDVSGDTAFARSMMPVIDRSIEGNLLFHSDSLGFLSPGPAGTTAGVRLQAAWKRQLEAGIAISSIAPLQAEASHVGKWISTLERLKANFSRVFVDTAANIMTDPFGPGGIRDARLRPGVFPALDLVSDSALARRIFLAATSALVYPAGVGTLASSDSGFVPYRYLPDYPSFAAGALNGPIDLRCTPLWCIPAIQMGYADSAYRVIRNTETLVSSGPFPGSFPEILDVCPKPDAGEAEYTGEINSLLSAAGYLQVWYQGFLGVTQSGWGRHLTLRPNLPAAVRSVDFNVPVRASSLRVEYRSLNGEFRINLEPEKNCPPVEITLVSPPGSSFAQSREATVTVQPGRKYSIRMTGDAVLLTDSTGTSRIRNTIVASGARQAADNPLRFAPVPSGFDPGRLARPAMKILSARDLTRNPVDPVSLCTARDPARDESAPYPDLRGIVPGSLDITSLEVRRDAQSIFFRVGLGNVAASFPEQLCGMGRALLAIAIDTGGARGKRHGSIGRNAGCSIPDFTADEIIYIGKGLTVEDANGKIRAEYEPIPADDAHPLAQFAERTVAVSLPAALLGVPGPAWRYAVVTGVREGWDVPGRFLAKTDTQTKGSEGNVYDILVSGKRGSRR